MNGRPWLACELEILRDLYPHVPTPDVAALLARSVKQTYAAAASYGIKKSPEFLASDLAGRILRGKQNPNMKATQFKKGLTPWNKGQKYNAGGRSVLTRFQKGRLPHEALNYKPVGSLRINADGYLERKITDDHPSPARRWVPVHRLVWIQHKGNVPDGHIIAFKMPVTYDKTSVDEITIDRLECISRAANAERNHWKNKSADLRALVPLKAAIIRGINRAQRRTPNSTAAEALSPNIFDVRTITLEQMRALRTAPPGPALEAEIARSKGVAELGQVMINTAKVEIDYLTITNQPKSAFLDPKAPGLAITHTTNGTAVTDGAVTKHRMRG